MSVSGGDGAPEVDGGVQHGLGGQAGRGGQRQGRAIVGGGGEGAAERAGVAGGRAERGHALLEGRGRAVDLDLAAAEAVRRGGADVDGGDALGSLSCRRRPRRRHHRAHTLQFTGKV